MRALACIQGQGGGKGEEKVNFLARWSSQAFEMVLLTRCKTTKQHEKKRIECFPPPRNLTVGLLNLCKIFVEGPESSLFAALAWFPGSWLCEVTCLDHRSGGKSNSWELR